MARASSAPAPWTARARRGSRSARSRAARTRSLRVTLATRASTEAHRPGSPRRCSRARAAPSSPRGGAGRPRPRVPSGSRRETAPLLWPTRIDQVVLDVRGRAAQRAAVLGPVARKQDAPPVHRWGRVRLAPVAPVEHAVLVGEALDRLAPVQLHGDDLVAEPHAVLLKVVDIRPARPIQVARGEVVRVGLVR